MTKTQPRIQFKKHLGQANHFLITSLVALHALGENSVVEAPEELRTAWNPKDKSASISRSRNFVLQSFLGWAVDSVDMYLSLLNRKPNYLQNSSLSSRLDGAGRSVLKKVRIYSEHYKVQPLTQALIDVLITWRNNVFHELADNELSAESRKGLAAHATDIAAGYRGLDVTGLAEKSKEGAALTFKETASLINAAHNFVQEVDAAVLAAFDAKAFCIEAVQDALNDKKQEKGFAAKYLCLSTEKRVRFLHNWFMNSHGFSELSKDAIESCLNLSRQPSVVSH